MSSGSKVPSICKWSSALGIPSMKDCIVILFGMGESSKLFSQKQLFFMDG
jgi:hypothetical protein